MTTEIIKNMSPRLPPPHRYREHVDRVLDADAGKDTSEADFTYVVFVFVCLFIVGLSLP